MSGVVLSIVVPMYDEEEIARETVRRLLAVGERAGLDFEVLGVDDGSRDNTLSILKELAAADSRVRFHSLGRNQGHFPATKAGLKHARGEMIVVLDADLQTPPELIPDLVAALRGAPPSVAAVFGVTSTATRDDPPVLLIGQAIFYAVQTTLSRHPIPKGASSFFIIRQDVARRIASLRLRDGNVGAVVAALGLGATSVHYDKPASYRESSRLGFRGHMREALGSMALTGVLTRLGGAGAILLGGTALLPVVWRFLPGGRPLRVALACGAALSAAVAVASELYTRAALVPEPSGEDREEHGRGD